MKTKTSSLLLFLAFFLPYLLFAEGSKQLTPNTGITNVTTLGNTRGGFLEHDANFSDANGAVSRGFLKPSTWTYNYNGVSESFSELHRMYIKVKAGETVYYGVHRTIHERTTANQANLILTLKYGSGAGTQVQQTTLTRNQSSTQHMLLTEGQAGVIINAAEALAGPEVRSTTGSAILANSAGYNPLVYTNNTGADRDFYIEFTQVGENALTETQRFSVYDFWDFTVRSTNTAAGVEKPGRLYSSQWAFSAGAVTGRFSSTFSLYPLIPSELFPTQNYVKRFDLDGLWPQNYFRFVVNRFGTLSATGNTTFLQRRQSQTSIKGYPEFRSFVTNPDPEFWPSATTPTLNVSAASFCSSTAGGSMAFTSRSSDPGTFIIVLDLNGVNGYQSGTKDVLIERKITGTNDTTIVWNGVDGTGAVVPSGTVVKTYFKNGAARVNFPVFDAERNPDGFQIQNIRPVADPNFDLLFWDDSKLPLAEFPAPQTQLAGAPSTNGAHTWGATADDGDTYTVNTWSYGFINHDTINYTYVFNCDPDADGVANATDIDDDNDGITDVIEGGGVNPGAFTARGIPNYLDADYVHPLGVFRDLNNDGVNDLFDRDFDGIPNHFDLDSDGDGIPDAIEANAGVSPASYSNGRITGAVGANGMPNAIETGSETGVSTIARTNTDGDAVTNAGDLDTDAYDLDSDNDGIWDNLEAQATTGYRAPLGTDADKDGWDDRYDTACTPCGVTGVAIVLSNKDALDNADYRDTDSDNDGQRDWIEGFDDDKSGFALNDFQNRVNAFVAAGGSSLLYPTTDANTNGIPDYLDDANSNGVPNFLDYTNTTYYFDSNQNGIVDLLDNTAGQFGAPSTMPKQNAANPDVDFRNSAALVYLRAEAELAVINTVAAGPYYNGQNVIYTVSVTNNGPNTGTGVSITDLLPAGLTFVSANAPAGTSYANGTGIWTVGSITSGQTQTLTITAKPNTTGTINTTASITAANEFDSNTTNNSASNSITVNAAADVAVTNTVAAGPYYVGKDVTYTVTVNNQGPNAAAAVSVSDLLPAGLTFVSAAPSTGSYNSGTGAWTVGTVNSGISQTLTIVARPNTTGTINTSATATSTTFDPAAANNTAANSITVNPSADVAVTNSVSSGPYYNGQNVTYTITATNNGPSAASGVNVEDLLPAGMTLVSSSPSTGTYTNGNWVIGGLTNGQTETLTIVAKPQTATIFTNTATATAATYDAVPANNVASNTITIQPSAEVSVTNTVSAGPYYVGNDVAYTVTVSNSGPNAAAGVSVADALPAGLTFVSASASTGSYVNGTWTVGTVNSGASQTLTIVARPNTTGTINTTATASSTTFDPTAANNSASNSITVGASADVQLTQVVSGGPTYNLGQTVTFTLTALNNGPNTASTIVVTDQLPGGFTYTGSSATLGTYNPTTGEWAINSLTNGQNAVLTINATINSTGTLTNNANITSAATYDAVTGNNFAGRTITVAPAADIAVTNTVAPGPYYVGQPVTYTVTATNNGPDNATGVSVTDQLPNGLTFNSANPSQGSYTNGVWNIGAVNAGQTVTLTLVGTPTAAAAYTTTATKTAADQYDNAVANNSAQNTITVVEAADLSISIAAAAGPTGYGYSTTSPAVTRYVDYTVVVSNNGPNTANTVAGTFDLPAGMIFDAVVTSPAGFSYNNATEAFSYSNSLASGASFTYVIRANFPTSNATGPQYTTSVSVSGNPADPNTVNNTDQVTVTAVPATDADVAVTNTVTAGPYYAGNTVIYTVTAENNGPQTATSLSVNYAIPANLTVNSVTPGIGTYSAGVWTIGDLAPGAESTLTINATINTTVTGGTIISTVAERSTPTAGNPDFVSGNNTATRSITVTESADLQFVQTVSGSPYYVGQPFTYTFTVTNNGPDAATNVVVTDPITPGLAYVSNSGATAGTSFNAGTKAWTIPTLAAGASATISITVEPTASGNYNLTASITSSDQYDRNTVNNSDSDPITVNPSADIAVTNTPAAGPYYVGQNVMYKIVLENNGPSTATGVSVSDLVPAGFTFVSAATTGNTAGTYDFTTDTWTNGTMPSGDADTLWVVVTPVTPGTFTTTTVSTAVTNDPIPGNNSSATSITVNPTADVAVNLSMSAPSRPVGYYQGEEVTFTVIVTNNGPNAASGIKIFDNLPSGISYVPGSVTLTQGSIGVDGTWTAGSLAVGANATLTVRALLNASGTFTNTASKTEQTEFDPVTSNNSSTITFTTNPAADVAVVNTVSAGPYYVGNNLIYTIEVTNNGPKAATNLVIDDLVPAGMSLVSATPSFGTYDPLTGDWGITTLNSGESETLILVVTPNSAGNYTNTAQVISQTEYDPTVANNTSANTITVLPKAELAVTNTVSAGPYYLGQPVTYTVAVTNNGPSQATLVSLTDLLPAGLTFVSANAAAGTSYANGTGVWAIDTIASGQTKILTIVAEPNTTGNITTTASLNTLNEYDPDTANNSASNSITVGADADLAVTQNVTAGPYNKNDSETFTVTVTNNGPSPTTGVEITYPLPAGLTITNTLLSTGTYNAVTGIWTVGSLAINGSATLTIEATLAVEATYTLTASVTAQGLFDPEAANNTASVTLFVDKEATYSNFTPINKEALSNGYVVASVIDNDGGVVSASILSGTLPAGLQFNAITGQVTVTNIALVQAGTTNLVIQTTDASGGVSENMVAIDIYNDNEAVYTVTNLTSKDVFVPGFVVASVIDADGTITSATLANGATLPAFVTLNTTTGAITVNTNPVVNGTYTFDIQTVDISNGTTLITSQSFTVISDLEAVYTNNTPVNQDAPIGTVLASVTDANGLISGAVINTGTLPAGATLNGNGNIVVTDTLAAGTYPLNITTTDATGGTTTQNLTLTIITDQEAAYTTPVNRYWNILPKNTVLASATDGNGKIVSALLNSTTLPFAGAIGLNPVTGAVTVVQPGLLRPGTYNLVVTTTDTTGGITVSTIVLNLLQDQDGDGVPDAADVDDNNDGITDLVSTGNADMYADADGDDIYNFADVNFVHPVYGAFANLNNDGINDAFDRDRDGITDNLDLDIDGDGIYNTIEANGGNTATLPGSYSFSTGRFNGAFVNSSGLPSAVNDNPALLANPDTDSDGYLDIFDQDSDNDGLLDRYESVTDAAFNANGVPAGSDTDQDGMDNRYDAACGCAVDGSTTMPVNTQSGLNNMPDYLDLDADTDGAPDAAEGFDDNENGYALDDLTARASAFETASPNAMKYDNALDADNDGIPDWMEDGNNDGIRNYLDPATAYYFDTDKDGLIDLFDTDNFGSPARMMAPDNNNNGIPDFRDNGEVVPLPVNLVSFTAENAGPKVKLTWATAQELNNAYFQVERSQNGKTFTAIGKTAGKGTTNDYTAYSLLDTAPLSGLSYYRLKQADFDGKASYSRVIAVNRAALSPLQAYPNPFTSSVTVKINTEAACQLQVYDLKGMQLYEQTTARAQHTATLDLSHLPAGVYMLRLQTQNAPVQQVRLVKE